MIFLQTGYVYKEQCPKQKHIPIYLIVAGSFTILRQILDLFARCATKDDDGGNQRFLTCDCCKCLTAIISLFMFGWFIAGNIWIYSAYEPNYTDPISQEYCHKTLYLFAFWLTTSVYICVAFFCCCLSCLVCCSAVCTVFEER